MKTQQMLEVLATLSLLNRETAQKAVEVLGQFHKSLEEAREAVSGLCLEEVFVLVFPDDVRPEVFKFTSEQRYAYGSPCLIGLVRDPRVPGFGVPVLLEGSAWKVTSSSTRMLIPLFTHQYIQPVNRNNCLYSSEGLTRAWCVATFPEHVDRTNNLPAHLEYYRRLLELAHRAGIRQLYLPPQQLFDHWKYRMGTFVFEQVRAELGIDCRLVQKFDPAFCEFVDGKIALREDAPLLLQFLP